MGGRHWVIIVCNKGYSTQKVENQSAL